MALEQAFVAIESQLYAGRVAQRRALLDMLRLSAQSPIAVYIYGPRDVGKSALLRAFLRDAKRPSVLLRGAEAAEGAQAILQLLAVRLTAVGVPTDQTLASVRTGLQKAARRSGLVVAVDGYDDLGAAERWLREEILYHIGAGAMLVLCGRSAPAQLWPGERVWRAFVRLLPLAELPEQEADELLLRQGVAQESLRRAAYGTVGGWPRSLLAAADALQASHACSPMEVAGRVLEQILHPGSRRRQWRAGGSPGDELIAAAAVLPTVRRDVLRVAVGGSVLDQGWELLMRIAHPGTDGYAIPERLGAALERHVLRVRPWQAQHWRDAALHAAIGRLRARRGMPLQLQDWREIAVLWRNAPWHAALHPGAEKSGHWRVERADLQQEEIAGLPGASPDAAKLCMTLLEQAPESIITLRDDSGQLLAWLLLVPAAARGGLLADHPRWSSLPSGSGFGHHALHMVLAAAGESRAAPGGVAVLVRETVPDWLSARRVFAETGSLQGANGEDLLQALGFRPIPPLFAWSEFEVPGQAHQLVERLPAGARVSSPPERERALAVKEALGRLFDGDLSGTAIARFLQARDGEGADAAAYVRDALLSADLGKPASTGREILRLYYVERLGSHETVADRLELPRATYFRLHKQAIARLSSALCN
ncbi:MAG: hypothetical protein M0Z66_04890 [Thermaerobacter sp.]|nr:hypothetical protein [Thermaerobacter sp.]